MTAPAVEQGSAERGCGACFGCRPGQRASAPQIYPTRPTTAFERMKEFLRMKPIRGSDSLDRAARAAVWAGWTPLALAALERDLMVRLRDKKYAVVYGILSDESGFSPVIIHIPSSQTGPAGYADLIINLGVRNDTGFLSDAFRPVIVEHETRHLRQIDYFDTNGSGSFDVRGLRNARINFLLQKAREIQGLDVSPQFAEITYSSVEYELAGAEISDLLSEVSVWAKAAPAEKGVYAHFIKALVKVWEGKSETVKALNAACYQAIADGHGIRIENADFIRAREQLLANEADKKTYEVAYKIFVAQFKVAQRYLPA